MDFTAPTWWGIEYVDPGDRKLHHLIIAAVWPIREWRDFIELRDDNGEITLRLERGDYHVVTDEMTSVQANTWLDMQASGFCEHFEIPESQRCEYCDLSKNCFGDKQ